MTPRSALTAAEIGVGGRLGGLTVVGSYADRTKAQVARVPSTVATAVTLDLTRLGGEGQDTEVRRAVAEVNTRLGAGEDVILGSSREYLASAGSAIGEALAAVVAGVEVRPRYLLVKGGSTASEVATEVLGVTRATVLGQLMAGVPVWRLGDESRWPGLSFVIFPGNVGRPESLAEALRLLRGG
jgi:uncharacterized protein YgbK (DUF1537 family)